MSPCGEPTRSARKTSCVFRSVMASEWSLHHPRRSMGSTLDSCRRPSPIASQCNSSTTTLSRSGRTNSRCETPRCGSAPRLSASAFSTHTVRASTIPPIGLRLASSFIVRCIDWPTMSTSITSVRQPTLMTRSALRALPDHFKPGEVYNICGDECHSIKRLSDLVLRQTAASKKLARYKKSEAFNTLVKRGDNRKAKRDLHWTPRVRLEIGIRRTIDWQRSVYFGGNAA